MLKRGNGAPVGRASAALLTGGLSAVVKAGAADPKPETPKPQKKQPQTLGEARAEFAAVREAGREQREQRKAERRPKAREGHSQGREAGSEGRCQGAETAPATPAPAGHATGTSRRSGGPGGTPRQASGSGPNRPDPKGRSSEGAGVPGRSSSGAAANGGGLRQLDAAAAPEYNDYHDQPDNDPADHHQFGAPDNHNDRCAHHHGTDDNPATDHDRGAASHQGAGHYQGPGHYHSGGGAQGSVYYPNCAAARAAGVAPMQRGDPGYSTKLDRDRDGDGIACEK